MDNFKENYNLINYLKIIDISLFNLFDYFDINNEQILVESDDHLVMNFTAKVKDTLEKIVINNVNDKIYYNTTNILVDTCEPKDNWRCFEQFAKKKYRKYFIKDKSIYIDPEKLNSFFSTLFKSISTKRNMFNEKSNLMLVKNLLCLNFKAFDIFDTFLMTSNILSNFGIVKKDDFAYNLIDDGNCVFMHGTSFSSELQDNVRLQLMKKGII